MFTILIVNHHKSEREALVSVLSQAFVDIEQIYEAADSNKAVSLYKQYQPDIVLLDMNLPKINGLECAKLLKKATKGKHIKLIIQTTEQDLQDVQKAIQIGVEDYLVKPIDNQQMIRNITKIIDQLQIEKNHYQQIQALLEKVNNMSDILEEECVKLILTNQNELSIQHLLSLMHMHMKYGTCVIFEDCSMSKTLRASIKNDIADIGYFPLLGVQGSRMIMLIMHSKKMNVSDMESIKNVLVKYRLFDHAIGMGHVAKGTNGLYESYLRASANIHELQDTDFSRSMQTLPSAPFNTNIDCEQCVDQILQLVKHHDDAGLTDFMREFVKTLLPLPADQINSYIKTFIILMKKRISEIYHVKYEKTRKEYIIVKESNKYQLLDIRMNYILHVLLKPVQNQLYQNINPHTKRALTYIKKNYRKAISLDDVAKSLHVSPFYLSKLLNHELHKTFTDIVCECRIEQAKNLLKEHYLVKTVAGMTGFQSSGYFSKVFKKEIGITPTEYRDIFM